MNAIDETAEQRMLDVRRRWTQAMDAARVDAVHANKGRLTNDKRG